MRARVLLCGLAVALGCGSSATGGADGGAEVPDGARPPDATPAPDAAPAVVPPEDTPESAAFALGVASGDVTPAAAILWTRYDGILPLRLYVWQMSPSGAVYVREVASDDVVPADGGFVQAEVTGLAPGGRYRFAFVELDGDTRVGRSKVGRFRSAPDEDALSPVVFGATSGTENSHSFETLERAGERIDLDFFVLLGDTTYNDGAETVDDYRAMWAQNLATPGYLALGSSTSLLATWDDHETINNWDAETVDPALLAAARQVTFENLPIRRFDAEPDRLWRSVRWGRTAEIFVLDCRGERIPSLGEYVSREQLDWLKAGLADSPAVFKVIVNSVPIGDFPLVFDAAMNDRWEGFPEQREEILAHIDDNAIAGVIWLSGDFHLASLGRVAESGLGATQLEILSGPGGQTQNPLWSILYAPQFDWASGTNNYTAIHLDPVTRQVRVVFIDGSGQPIEDRTYTL